jgi:two-component system, sensor histidine kinase and response regulator
VREEAERLEIDGFLVKPLTKSMLVDTLITLFAPVTGERAPAATPATHGRRLEGARILMAEDNEINQQIAVELMEGEGARVTVANNGREATEALGAAPDGFDVVMMDLQMPEMDGYQATTWIRSDGRFAALPVIAITAHATIEERQRCLAAGMNDHVAKPIDPAALFDVLGRYYRATAGAAENASLFGESASGHGASSPGGGSSSAASGHAAAGGSGPATNGTGVPEIAGVDTAQGLSRVAGNVKLYRKLLRQFADEQRGATAVLRERLGGGDLATAERMAHNIKGVGANLGMAALYASAGEVESAISHHATGAHLAAALDTLERALVEQIARIDVALPAENGEPAAEVALDRTRIQPAVEQMQKHLDEFDAAATDHLDANRELFRAIFSADGFDAFEKRVQNFAFAEARAELDAAARASGVSG